MRKRVCFPARFGLHYPGKAVPGRVCRGARAVPGRNGSIPEGNRHIQRTEPFQIPPLTPFGEYCLIVHVGPYPQKWDTAEDCFKVVLFADGEFGLEWENETFSAAFREMA